MNRRPSHHEPPDPQGMWPPPGTGQWLVLALGVAVMVLVVKLLPFDFSGPGTDRLLSLAYAGPWMLLGQVVLFVPMGLVEAQLARRLVGSFSTPALLLVTMDAALVSLIGETGQYWIPQRTSSLLDVLANTLGGVAGYMICLHLSREGP